MIHWQAHAGKKLGQEDLKAALTQRLPDYPILQPQHDVQIAATVELNSSPEVSQSVQWSGFRLQDQQSRHVAQFMLSGVAFSRLEPYEAWDSFQAEALRFWQIFLELTHPTVIQRLGVRYINRIPLEVGETASKYLSTTPAPPVALDLAPDSFFHQDTYPVPGYPYRINWVRTIQPASPESADGQALIVDIDVFTHELITLDQDALGRYLQEMRWLKNKVFFSCMTPYALKRFGAMP